MNWTTTKIPLWQVDCESFRKVGRPFELRDVTAPEHWEFVEPFALRNNIQYTKTDTTVYFDPQQQRSA
jgi:hypothetical protein